MAARLPDLATLIQAGIDPNTGLPIKMETGSGANLKESIKKQLRIIDEQDAVNRYVWRNLPCNITSQELERIIYYRGNIILWYCEELDEFYFMPYALDGGIDFYGRYSRVHPIPLYQGKSAAEQKQYKAQYEMLAQKKLKPIYAPMLYEPTEEELKTSCVILFDYTKQLQQTNIPRQILQEGLLDVMAECIPLLRTNLIAGSGVKGMRVQDADQYDAVLEASRAVENNSIHGQIYVPIVGTIDFQEIAEAPLSKSEEYLVALQSLDNFRLSCYGLENGGLFEKKAQMLQAENALNTSKSSRVYQDGLLVRQAFCNIVNSIWGLGIWCDPAEVSLEVDLDGDGLAQDQDLGDSSGMEVNDGTNDTTI